MNALERLIISLRIKGFGKPDNLAEALGVSLDACAALLAELKTSGLSDDTRVGARLTPTGKARANELLAVERAGADAEKVVVQCERFTPVNAAFKHLITRWQMREIDGKQVRNDHGDGLYDAAVLADFDVVHNDVSSILDALQAIVPRYAAYGTRLSAALGKIKSGDPRFVAAPDLESYHSIWFELHQDLIELSGTTRAKEAAAGRAL